MITINEKTDDTLSFSVDNIAMANSIRIAMISQVEILAINKIYIETNTSNLCDEILSHRLGLLVVNSRHIDTVDAGPEDESVYFSLDVICDEDEMFVTPSMFKCSNELVTPVNSNTPIIKLFRGQSLRLICIINRGTGTTHAKWISMILSKYSIDGDTVSMSIETVGSLDSLDILQIALKKLKEKLQNLLLAIS